MTFSNEIMVQMQDIRKTYPGVVALNKAGITVRKGEIMALMGENGAGKSTLIKMLTGAEQPDSGSITVSGKTFNRMTPAHSEDLGIACVYQNLVLAEQMTVAENIWMGQLSSGMGYVSQRTLRKKTEKILNDIGYGGIIAPSTKVADLTASQQGMVAIVRAISRDAKIVIFDEPTAVLADREVEELFRVIRLLKEKHLAIIYISHRMEEIFDICDTITVLKDGQYVGAVPVAETSESKLITMMVGRELSASNYHPERKKGGEMLRVENVTNKNVSDCSFTVNKGEIVGVYGLVGAGRTELSRAIFGADAIDSGKIFINGKAVTMTNPRKAIDHGMSLVPEDRRRHGLTLKLSVRHNINLPVYRRFSKFGFIPGGEEKRISSEQIQGVAVKTPSDKQIVKNLSGGNQQKVVLGKWLASESKIFLMDEPTNGIDVGAKEEIYKLINDLACNEGCVLCVSSYMPELIDICDRILVMNRGRIVGEIPREEFNEEMLLSLAIRTDL